jgi:GNAT superfamily N-acetyltransferase
VVDEAVRVAASSPHEVAVRPIDGASESRVRRPQLSVDLRCARTDLASTGRYLSEILWPGIRHATEGAGLFNTDAEHLSSVSAKVVLGWAGTELAAGLYIIIDAANVAWLNGVRVAEPYRNRGYGSNLVRWACALAGRSPDVKHHALTVRCDNSGTPYNSAFATYVRCGFTPIGEPYSVTVSGLLCDRHLGPPGSRFLTLRMESRP